MLYVSTDYVFDGAKNGPYVEDDARESALDATAARSSTASARVARARAAVVDRALPEHLRRGAKSFVDAILARARRAAR